MEIGGAGTLPRSIRACRMGGHIALIGVLAGLSGEIPSYLIFGRQLRISSIAVGSREDQEAMVRGIEASGIRPIIDFSFPLEQLAQAYRHQASQAHFGKISIQL